LSVWREGGQEDDASIYLQKAQIYCCGCVVGSLCVLFYP